MRRARSLVFPNITKSLASSSTASDLYLKFIPQNEQDLNELEESGFFFLDYPLTQELVAPGDFYKSAAGTDFPELYTTVSVGTSLPNVPYKLIDELNLTEQDSRVIYKAFELTGNEQEFLDTYGEPSKDLTICIENEYRDHEEEIISRDVCGAGGGGGSTPPSGGTSTFIKNNCGCSIFRNERKPGGTVKVEDTQFGTFLPVRRVEIVAKNGWFTRRRVNTDDNGCWRIDREYSGKAWFWVRFKDKASKRGKVRFAGVRGWRFWQKARTGTVNLGVKRGPNFHNIITRFGAWDGNTTGTKTHYAWAGATINNALHEFHDHARAEGFRSPPQRLNVLVGMRRSNGFATMLRQIGSHNFITAVNQGVGFWLPNQLNLTVNDAMGQYLLAATGSAIWPQPSFVLNTFLGDINIGGDFEASDNMKRLAYHEFGHGSHFMGTSINFHRNVIAAEVGAFGHGNPDVNLAGHIQIAESWAEHMALTMSIRQYPPSVNNNGLRRNWTRQLEEVRNESPDHVPIGVYQDLIDPINTSERVFDEKVRTSSGALAFENLNDGVDRAFTNRFFAQQLDATIRSVEDIEEVCISQRPSRISAISINQLFNEY